jgi:hypothetical protein
VTKLLLLLAVAALGCRDSKKPTKQADPTPGAAQDPAWIDRLPQVAGADSKLSLDMAAGLVSIKRDGTIYVVKPPAAAADPRHLASDPLAGAKPVQLAELTKQLGIAPVTPRTESAYAPATGSGDAPENAADAQYARLGHPSQASGAPPPAKRATTVFALAHAHDVTAGVIVFADAQAPASVLVDVLAQTGGFLAVRRGRELGALPLAFDRQAPAAVSPDKTWTEVRLGPAIEVETVPSAATKVAAIDKLADAVKVPAADVLVAPDTKVQDLLAAIGSLRTANVEALGFGVVPAANSPEAATRGDHGPRVLAWNFSTQGPGDVGALRAAFDGALAPVRDCYTKELAKTPTLTASAQLQFLVRENAQVATVDLLGVPRPLVACVTAAIKAAKYPAPSSAAGMNVTATLSFLPK